MSIEFIACNNKRIIIPHGLLVAIALSMATVLVIIYFSYQAPLGIMQTNEAHVVLATAFLTMVYTIAVIAAACTPGLALWPTKYAK
jgi:hypothetical protein